MRKIQIQLSEWEYRQLKKWAYLHDKPTSTYAAQIVGARIEANAQLIAELFSKEAESLGISEEELLGEDLIS